VRQISDRQISDRQITDRQISDRQISYRGTYGQPRPPQLNGIALPPQPMPPRLGLRPLKAWRYIGVFGPELMLCAAIVRIGPARQSFWAVWDRRRGALYERTRRGRGGVALPPGRLLVSDEKAMIDLTVAESAGVETVCPSGAGYAWTRKQGGVEVTGTVTLQDERRELTAHAVIDDTAAYYQRHTVWRWSAGVGRTLDGAPAAWNLVDGVNDPDRNSERTVWIGHEPREVPPQPFAADLSSVGGLRFACEATRERRENLVLVRSRYRQPFGTFAGTLPDGTPLREGYGVMEEHDVTW
jgi:hypothetical protein